MYLQIQIYIHDIFAALYDNMTLRKDLEFVRRFLSTFQVNTKI